MANNIKEIVFGKSADSDFFSSMLSFSLGLLTFVFAAFPSYSTIFISLPAILIISGYLKGKIQFNWTWIHTFFSLLYLFYLISFLWTEAPEIGLKQLEYKLSLIVFPILFAFKSKKQIPFSPIIWIWMVGLIYAGYVGLSAGYDCYFPDGTYGCWVSSRVSPIHHPTYFTAFNSFLLLLIWRAWKMKENGFNLIWIIPFTIASLVYHVLLLSMAGILFLLLVIGVLIFISMYKRFGVLITSISSLGFLLLMLIFLNNVPWFSVEWQRATSTLSKLVDNPKEYVESLEEPLSGNEQRIILWTVSTEELAQNPIGSGIGSVDKKINSRLLELDQKYLASKGYNPHNQFLQTGIELGWSGLIFFCFILIALSRYAWKHKNLLLGFLIANLIFNCFFESMLQRQSGIVFYLFWIFLLILFQESSNKLSENKNA